MHEVKRPQHTYADELLQTKLQQPLVDDTIITRASILLARVFAATGRIDDGQEQLAALITLSN